MAQQSAARFIVIKSPSTTLAGRASAMRGAWRGVQRSCGSARHRTSAVQQSWPAHVRHRSSKVEFNLAAIPPGTCTPSPCARSSRAFRIAAARSGPLVQRVRDTLHRFARINVAAVHLDTKAGASERNTIVPRSTVRATLAVGPSRALEAVSPPHKLSVLVGVWETSGSQTPTKTVSPSAQDRLQRQRSTAFRALWHRKIHRRLPPVLHQYAIVITRCDQPPAILPAP